MERFLNGLVLFYSNSITHCGDTTVSTIWCVSLLTLTVLVGVIVLWGTFSFLNGTFLSKHSGKGQVMKIEFTESKSHFYMVGMIPLFTTTLPHWSLTIVVDGQVGLTQCVTEQDYLDGFTTLPCEIGRVVKVEYQKRRLTRTIKITKTMGI